MRNILAILLTVLSVAACTANVRYIKTSDMIGATFVSETFISVEKEIVFQRGSNTIRMPPGKYLPIMVDEFGAFYESPKKIIISGGGLIDGGIHVKFSEFDHGYLYASNEFGVSVLNELPPRSFGLNR